MVVQPPNNTGITKNPTGRHLPQEETTTLTFLGKRDPDSSRYSEKGSLLDVYAWASYRYPIGCSTGNAGNHYKQKALSSKLLRAFFLRIVKNFQKRL